MPPIGYSYVRFSSKKQGKGSSLYRQTQDTMAGESPESWCARNNVLFSPITYRDLGLSGWDGANVKQGELRVILDAIKSGKVRRGDYLLVERVDRITRQGVDVGMDIIKEILRAGVSIVTLANGRVYGPDACKGLMKGLLELQMYLEAAQQYSDALSGRVAAAWERKREKAGKGTLTTGKMPPWLRAVGDSRDDNRHAVVVPEKVATVQRIFAMAIAGQGLKRIVNELIKDGTPPITSRGTWSRTGVRRIITDRAVLGEYQPTTRMRRVPSDPGDSRPKWERAEERIAAGDPIANFPEIIDLATFHKAQACLGSRKNNKQGRDSKVLNVFSGLLKDARNGVSYITDLRVEQGRNGNADTSHYVLISAVKTGDSRSFPFPVFEKAALSVLQGIDPRELLTGNGHKEEVLGLAAELESIKAEIAAIEAAMDQEFSDTLNAVLRRKEARKKAVASKLAEAQQRVACPLSESWGEARTVFATLELIPAAGPPVVKLPSELFVEIDAPSRTQQIIEAAPDRGAVLLRLRAVLRRLIESIHLLVVARGTIRLCAFQVSFASNDGNPPKQRTYLITHRPAVSNQHRKQEARYEVRPFTEAETAGLDLRQAGDAARLEAELAELVGQPGR
jgi:DNA invertase Pin-like site-specific DNA recombinase